MHRCKNCYLTGAVIALVILIVACCHGLRSSSVIDTHEHIESLAKAEMLLEANKANNIIKTVLVPSPTETLTLNGHKSFTGYRENVDELLRITEKYPKHFIPLCAVSPMDSDALEYLKSCIDRGGKGLKLYNGHSYYYDVFSLPLDSPRMTPIYAFCERNKIPILYHINITKYGDELESILNDYPDLVVSVPHYMVSSIGLDKVTTLLDKYPNLYTDISFGSPEFMAAGFRRISRDIKKYANFANDYSDRILFGADMVLTNTEHKDTSYMQEKLACYKDILEKRSFECKPVVNYYAETLKAHELSYENCEPKEGEYCQSVKVKMETQQGRVNEVRKLNGLGLSSPVLEKIYRTNPTQFLNAND